MLYRVLLFLTVFVPILPYQRTWTIVKSLPPGGVDDGVTYQAVVQFSFRNYIYDLNNCEPMFKVGVAYIQHPPPDNSDFCRFETSWFGFGSTTLLCRRRKHLLNIKQWIKVTLQNFAESGLSPRELGTVQCLQTLLPTLYIPKLPTRRPTVIARTTTTPLTMATNRKTTTTTTTSTTNTTPTTTSTITPTTATTTTTTATITIPPTTTSTTTTTKIGTTARESQPLNSTSNAVSIVTSVRIQHTSPHTTAPRTSISKSLNFVTTTTSKRPPLVANLGEGHSSAKETHPRKDPDFASLLVILTPLIALKLLLLILLIFTIRCLRKNHKQSERLLGGKPFRTEGFTQDRSSPSTYTHPETTVTMDLWDYVQKPESKATTASKESVKRSPDKDRKIGKGRKKKK